MPHPDSPERRLVSNTLVQFIPYALRIFMGLVLAATLSRYLGVQGFGEYGLVFAYVALYQGIFADWGLGTISLREVSAGAPRQLLVNAAYLQTLLSGAAYIILLASLSFMHYPLVVKVGAAVYGASLLSSPLDTLALTFQADLRMSKLIPASLLGSVATFALSMFVVLIHGGVVGLAVAALAAVCLQYAVIARLLVATHHFSTRPSRLYWKALLRESWPLAVVTIFSSITQQAPILVLSYASLGAVGLYSAANKIPLQLAILPIILRTSTFPLMAQSWKLDRAQFKNRLHLLLGLTGFVGATVAVVGALSAKLVMPVVFGAKFEGASGAFAWLMLGAGILIPGIVLGEVMIAAGMQRVNLTVQVASVPLLAVGLLVLVPRWGATGGAAAAATTYGAVVLAELVVLRLRIGSHAPVSWLLTPVAMGGAALATLYIARGIGDLGLSALTVVVAIAVGLVAQRSTVRWAFGRLQGATF